MHLCGFIGLYIGVIVIGFELTWLGVVLRRLPEDINDLVNGETWMDSLVVILIWIPTAGIAAHLGYMAWGIIQVVMRLF